MDIIKKISKKGIGLVISKLDEDDLASVIRLAAETYHNGEPLISDADYDLLVEKLKLLNPKNDVLTSVGAPVKGKKTPLPFWMGSMNKIKEEGELAKWVEMYEPPYVISDKLDGISALIVYEDGQISMYTRGNGTLGQNITHLLDYIDINVSGIEKSPKKLALRGELIMKQSTFQEKYSDIFANARNMVSGIVNSKKSSLNAEYATDVEFIGYEIIEPAKMLLSEQYKTMKKMKLSVVYHDVYDDITFEGLDSILQSRKKKSKYDIDGVVVVSNHIHNRNKMGNPDYAFAYKGLTETANVKVLNVTWNAQKDGHISPTINFETVWLSQANLSNTSGFNAKFINDNKIGPGAIIKVIRSGDTIPYILDIVRPAKKSALPDDMAYHWDKNEVNIVLDDVDGHEGVIIKRLTKFLHDLGVENMSEGIVTRLVKNGYDSLVDIITLTVDDLLQMEGFKERLANKLVTNLQESLNKVDMLTFMVATNAFGHGFGHRKLKKIMDVYPKIVDTYKKADYQTWYDKLLNIEGFDHISVEAFLGRLPAFQKEMKKLSNFVIIKPYRPPRVENGRFVGEHVVFTEFRNKDWQAMIEKEGGKVTGSVSKNTTLLVYMDGKTGSAKYQKAVKLGIRVLSRTEFENEYVG